MAFGSKGHEIERLNARIGELSEQRDELHAALGRARAGEVRAAELYVAADTDAMVVKAEAEGLSVALVAEHARAERYRAAWQSARRRAEAYGDGVLRQVANRDEWKRWFEQEQIATGQLRVLLSKSEQGRRNLHGLLDHHRDMGSLGMLRQHRNRLARALRACARYRRELAEQQRVNDQLSDQLMDAMGYGPAELRILGVDQQPEVTR